MLDISTNYLGIKLNNPIIASSSTLTDNIESIKKLVENGAAAVVLRSIFEEEITLESEAYIKEAVNEGFDEGLFDYFDAQVKQHNVEKYLGLIAEVKRSVDVPVIGSINAISNHEWFYFAKRMEESGVDAIELNLFLMPSDINKSCEEIEEKYFKIVERLVNEINIPVTIKISHYFSNLATVIKKLSEKGIKGLVLFNKFFTPDFDIEKEKLISTNILSTPEEIGTSLRWIALMSQRVGCDLVASTGVHNGEGMIKQLLAGAKAVQIASTLYKNGMGQIGIMINELKDWMERKGYESIEDFRGKLSYGKLKDPALLERVQFMKYFGGYGK